MTVKKWIFHLILLFFSCSIFASRYGQIIQINTNFSSVAGKASWLLIVRNEETGEVFPHIFDIKSKDNFWLVFTYGRAYRITASKLTMGPFAVTRNFCHLENGIITGKSIMVTLTGDLTPIPTSYTCKVMQFADAGEISLNN